MIKTNIEIKFLADCKQHIPYLAQLHYEQMSKIWIPNASIERSKQNVLKHATHSMPLTSVALVNGYPMTPQGTTLLQTLEKLACIS